MDQKGKDYWVNKIKSDYRVEQNNDLDELLSLDREVKLPPTILVYILGIIGALILGFGLSLVMTDIGQKLQLNYTNILGILLGIIGIIICAINYPIYKKYLNSRKEKFATEILRLTDKLQRN